jgi:hypothetical protein
MNEKLLVMISRVTEGMVTSFFPYTNIVKDFNRVTSVLYKLTKLHLSIFDAIDPYFACPCWLWPHSFAAWPGSSLMGLLVAKKEACGQRSKA